MAVVAGAGSGKTRVLTRRIAHRVAVGTADARHTLVLTFTRQAAGELRRRLHRLGLREHVEAGTFHSVMLALLRRRWEDTGTAPKTILSDRRRLVVEALDGGSRRDADAVLDEIGWAAARGIPSAAYAGAARREGRRPAPGIDRVAAAYGDFDRLKRRRGVIDFDDVLAMTARELQRDREFADATRWRFRHVLVDEAQDLNPLQHRLVDLLRHGRDDLFLVGDPAQAIYGFNGADPDLLVNVETRFPGVEVVRLPVNHRSSPQVVAAGVHVLATSRQPAELVSDRPDGRHVTRIEGDDEHDEATKIARVVVQADPNLIRSGSVAVLARTHAQLGAFEDAFAAVGIPVRRSTTAPGSPLQAAVRDAAAQGSASRLRGWAHDVLDVEPVAEPDAHDEALRRVAAAALDYLRESSYGDGAGFRAWIATNNPFDDGTDGGVELLTFHAAKGREWYLVAVTGVETSLVPHKSATTTAERAEEGRLLYVALTRATDELLVSHAARRGGYARKPSPFIEGLDLSEPISAPPPEELVPRLRRDPMGDALRRWRDEASHRAGVLPEQLCSDRDLRAIERNRPATVDELVEVTTLGPMTAARLAPELFEVLAGQSSRSTMTGA